MKVIEQSAHDFFYEHVYCLYSKQKVGVCVPPNGKYEEALSLLNTRKCDSPNAMLLKAQVLYRLERYDYLTNLSAAYLMSEHYTEGVSLLEKYKVRSHWFRHS